MRHFFLCTLITVVLGSGSHAGDGKTFFVQAACAGKAEIAAQQIAKGADVGAAGLQDGTALLLAAERNQIEIVRLLLEHGADINKIPRPNPFTGVVSMTPLMAASAQGHAAVVELLLAHGADASTQVGNTALYEEGVTALLLATVKGHTQVVDLLNQAAASGGRTWKYMVIAIWILLAVIIMVQPKEPRSAANQRDESKSTQLPR